MGLRLEEGGGGLEWGGWFRGVEFSIEEGVKLRGGMGKLAGKSSLEEVGLVLGGGRTSLGKGREGFV